MAEMLVSEALRLSGNQSLKYFEIAKETLLGQIKLLQSTGNISKETNEVLTEKIKEMDANFTKLASSFYEAVNIIEHRVDKND